MPKILHFCQKCNEYTMEIKKCNRCGNSVNIPHPPRYSLQDKYQKYRIPLFKEKYKNKK